MVLCGGSGADTIDGASVDNIICGGGGADTITGGLGKDLIDGGNGNDTIYAKTNSDFSPDGDSLIYAGDGNDTVGGAAGDDIIFAGDGDDVIVGQSGADAIKGEAGNDTLVANFGGPTPNDIVGTLLCGGTGNDILLGDGPGRQCMDGGADQSVQAGLTDDCTYTNVPDDADAGDVGTARNCAHSSKTSSGGTLLSRTPGCNCD